jgi:hypothetical protein
MTPATKNTPPSWTPCARDPAGARLAMRNHFQRLFESMLEATENEALAEIRRRTQQDRERFMAATGH